MKAGCAQHNGLHDVGECHLGIPIERITHLGLSAQPAPEPRPGVASIQSMVRADLEAREAFGTAKYGTPLQAHNGRDALRDAYEEALDLACYLKQAIVERDSVEPEATDPEYPHGMWGDDDG